MWTPNDDGGIINDTIRVMTLVHVSSQQKCLKNHSHICLSKWFSRLALFHQLPHGILVVVDTWHLSDISIFFFFFCIVYENLRMLWINFLNESFIFLFCLSCRFPHSCLFFLLKVRLQKTLPITERPVILTSHCRQAFTLFWVFFRFLPLLKKIGGFIGNLIITSFQHFLGDSVFAFCFLRL